MPPQSSLSSSSSLDEFLAQYRISPRFAFLLEKPEERSVSIFTRCLFLFYCLPDLIESGANVRELIANLPEIEIPSSFSYEQLRLVHLLLCTLVSAYLWADKSTKPPSSIPRCLSIPFYSVSQSLGMKPVVSHHSTCLANWRRSSGDLDPSKVLADDLDLIAFRFLKTSGNVWFFTLNAQLEFDFAPSIVAAASICHRGSSSTSSEVGDALDIIINAINTCAALFVRFRERLTPSEFYHGLRPFLWGYANIEGGVVFEGLDDSSPSLLPGASAAQSCTIQTMDAFLGVKHTGAEDSFLREQREFMPAPHRAFIEWTQLTAQSSPLHSLLHSHPRFPDALRALDNFRSQHIRVVSLFISTQTSNSSESGTGGTPLMKFLKTVRADSNDVMDHHRDSHDEYFTLIFRFLSSSTSPFVVFPSHTMPLIIEYEGGYPFIFHDTESKVAGIFTELWRIVSEVLNEEIIFVAQPYSKTTFRNITEGRTLTRMDGTKLNPERSKTFIRSNVIRFSIDLFYERQRAGDLEESEISFFTVFKWETIALIFISNVISSICVFLLMQNARSSITKALCQIVQIIFLLCLTVIIFHHSAGFQGNNVVIKPGKETTFPDLIEGLHDGSRELWTDSPGFVYDDYQVYDLLIGSKIIHTVPNSEALLTKICDNPKAVTGMPLNWIMEMNLIENPCPLVSVKLTGNQGDETPGLETFAHYFSSHYVFSPDTDRKILWTVNEVLVKLFSQDRIDDYWIPRHVKRLRNFKPPLAVTSADYRPMNLLRLSLIIYIYLGLSVASSLVFVTEL
ncbi:hypothetical protein PENTCL1PPCAC_2658, partial [Pristionchus entomophagus]